MRTGAIMATNIFSSIINIVNCTLSVMLQHEKAHQIVCMSHFFTLKMPLNSLSLAVNNPEEIGSPKLI
jgi:hypothetical protein